MIKLKSACYTTFWVVEITSETYEKYYMYGGTMMPNLFRTKKEAQAHLDKCHTVKTWKYKVVEVELKPI